MEASRDAQGEAQETFQSALEQLVALIEYDIGDLEKIYRETERNYTRSESAATDVRDRVQAVEDIAETLFEEWETEIEEYGSASLKASSQRKLHETRERYAVTIEAMRASTRKMDPVLASLKDNVLYLKHNLNARGVGHPGRVRDHRRGCPGVDRRHATLHRVVAGVHRKYAGRVRPLQG